MNIFSNLFFDIVRQHKYPERKSRFVSVFGCLTLDDAKHLKATTFNGYGSIHKVSCEKYFIADMALIRQPASIIGVQIIAEKYWAGKGSTNPFWEVLMETPVIILEKVD